MNISALILWSRHGRLEEACCSLFFDALLWKVFVFFQQNMLVTWSVYFHSVFGDRLYRTCRETSIFLTQQTKFVINAEISVDLLKSVLLALSFGFRVWDDVLLTPSSWRWMKPTDSRPAWFVQSEGALSLVLLFTCASESDLYPKEIIGE